MYSDEVFKEIGSKKKRLNNRNDASLRVRVTIWTGVTSGQLLVILGNHEHHEGALINHGVN